MVRYRDVSLRDQIGTCVKMEVDLWMMEKLPLFISRISDTSNILKSMENLLLLRGEHADLQYLTDQLKALHVRKLNIRIKKCQDFRTGLQYMCNIILIEHKGV